MPLAPGVPLKLPVGVGDSEGHAVAVGVGEPQWEAVPEGVGAAETERAPESDGATLPLPRVLTQALPLAEPLKVPVGEAEGVAREDRDAAVADPLSVACGDAEGGALAVAHAVAQGDADAQAVGSAVPEGCVVAVGAAEGVPVPQGDADTVAVVVPLPLLVAAAGGDGEGDAVATPLPDAVTLSVPPAGVPVGVLAAVADALSGREGVPEGVALAQSLPRATVALPLTLRDALTEALGVGEP